MRMLSAWNYGTRKYDYYEAGEHEGTHITKPTVHSFAGGNKIGMTVEQFAARLPPASRRVGMGDVAQGQVASLGSGGVPSWLLYGVALLLAWRYFR